MRQKQAMKNRKMFKDVTISAQKCWLPDLITTMLLPLFTYYQVVNIIAMNEISFT
jgi:hypothetical protein